jgi:endonuclease/exonuclease/phosphatase family metal-dependent hydrolase
MLSAEVRFFCRAGERAVLMLACGLAAFLPATARAEEPLTVKAMTFNIRYDNRGDGANRWSKRQDAVVRIIRESKSDFVGIQEALPNQVADLKKGLPEYGFLGRSREADTDRGEATLVLYRKDRWRLDAERQGSFWLSDKPDKPGSASWGNTLPRMVAWGLFHEEKSGRGIFVFGTHFDHASEPARQKSAELLARRIAERGTSAPAIALGDLNAGEESEAVAILLGNKPGAAVKLVDTFRAVHPDEKQVKTFHGFEGGTDGEKIDYIFATPGVKVLTAEIVRDRILKEGEDARYPSDHYPMTAEMEFGKLRDLRDTDQH